MTTYPFDSIHINGRNVPIQDIISTTVIPQSEFEASAFSFIRDWINGVETFGQFTSGSTGGPKEIILTRAEMIVSARMTQDALGLRKGWHALLCLNPAYIAGKMMIVRSFVTGMKIIAVEPAGNPFLALAKDQSIDFAALVPYQIHDIVRSDKASVLDTIKIIIVGGAAINSETIDMLQHFTCQFYGTYGMTETISHVALMPLNGNLRSPYYTVLPGITITQDERGCLVINGNHLKGNTIITNDLVERINTTTFKWLGRWDNVINSGGLKVIPEKLEVEIGKITHELGINQNFVVSSMTDPKLGNKIILLLEHEISNPLLEKLKVEMKKRIPKHEVPKAVLSGSPFVFTDTGKINRAATVKHALDSRKSTI